MATKRQGDTTANSQGQAVDPDVSPAGVVLRLSDNKETLGTP